MATDELMTKALAALGEADSPISVEVIHRLADTSDVTDPMTITEVAALLDISAHTLPNLVFLIPNNCHNSHNTTTPGCGIPDADAWLGRANALSRMERNEEALASYDEALLLRANDENGLFNDSGGCEDVASGDQQAVGSSHGVIP